LTRAPKRCRKCLRLSSLIGAIAAAMALLVLIILKADTHTDTPVHRWTWKLVLLPGSVVLSLCVGTYLFTTFFAALENVDPDDEEYQVTVFKAVRVDGLRVFHEGETFRDVLLMMGYVVLASYAAFIAQTGCRIECNSPYGLMGVAFAVLYALRFCFVFVHTYYNFYRMKVMVNETIHFQETFNEKRLFSKALPDMTANGCAGLYHHWSAVIFFCCITMVALLGTVWIENGLCQTSCTKQFHCYKYLLTCVYLIEGFYIFTVLVVRYCRRTSGLEALEAVIQTISNNRYHVRELMPTEDDL
jgi:hypothetical protein